MDPLRFDFDAPLVEAPPPFRGRTKAAKHASWTGARHAVVTWGARASAYLQILAQGPKTDQEAHEILQKPLASVNSVRHAITWRFRRRHLADPIVDCGFDIHTWGDGDTTTRTRWGLRAPAQVLNDELASHPIEQKETVMEKSTGHEGAIENDAPTPPTGTVVSDQGDGATSEPEETPAAPTEGE